MSPWRGSGRASLSRNLKTPGWRDLIPASLCPCVTLSVQKSRPLCRRAVQSCEIARSDNCRRCNAPPYCIRRLLARRSHRTAGFSVAVASLNNLLAVASKHRRANLAIPAASSVLQGWDAPKGTVAPVLPQAPNARAARRDLFVRPSRHAPAIIRSSFALDYPDPYRQSHGGDGALPQLAMPPAPATRPRFAQRSARSRCTRDGQPPDAEAEMFEVRREDDRLDLHAVAELCPPFGRFHM